jgi:hypothetical protein
MVTRPTNPRFARALVNRLWKRLLGRGLAEPADDFDSRPLRSPLLDWLAYDFMSHDYDAKHTLRLILLCRAYQLPVDHTAPARDDPPDLVRGPTRRRLTAEQFLDAVGEVTGYWPRPFLMSVDVEGDRVRAWRHRKPDALATALGRPNREQVCTQRDEESTVLQALELVNGEALAMRLREGARTLLASPLGNEFDGEAVVRTLYRRALGRLPTDREAAVMAPLLGSPREKAEVRQQGWEDALWLLFASPEFSFIR